MTVRKTTSLTTLISFILLLFTSFILYVTPQGKIAFWANWKMLGLGKEEWGALHTNLGFLFIVAGILHTVLNWKAIVTYMQNKTQQLKVFTGDFNAALGICAVITLFTMLEWQPVHGIQILNHALKDHAAEKYGEPPYGHAEASSLQSFCKRTGLNAKEAAEKLKAAGLKAVSGEATVAEIAAANNMTPQQVYNIIKPEPAQDGATLPDHPNPGFGRLTMTQVCDTYGLDLESTITDLKEAGINASADAKMKEIADQNSTEPSAIYEAIQELQ